VAARPAWSPVATRSRPWSRRTDLKVRQAGERSQRQGVEVARRQQALGLRTRVPEPARLLRPAKQLDSVYELLWRPFALDGRLAAPWPLPEAYDPHPVLPVELLPAVEARSR